ncbi:MAG TPA: maltose ABC transporter permease MalF [Chthoniobacterales bacterium]
MNSRGFPIRQVLVALVFLPALYFDFVIYLAGNAWIALGMLVVIALGAYVYLSTRAYTFRYLFPGFLGFGLFVIFPLLYTVYIGFTKYNSQNLLSYDRAVAVLRQETYLTGDLTYTYRLYVQDDGRYLLAIQDDKDRSHRYVSDSFELKAGQQPAVTDPPRLLKPLEVNTEPPGKPLEMAQITREKLFIPMRGRQFALPDHSLVALEGLTKFAARQPLWNLNPDGTLTNRTNGNVIHADSHLGYFTNEKGEKVGVGFRTFSGFENYYRILTDPRIQGPFLKIFLWTVAFSGLSVVCTFAVGIFLAVILQWKELRGRRVYRTLLILPYAVPAVLSILIFRGLFNQEFGAVNAFLKAMFHFAPEWETNPWGARAMILLVNVWLGYPYMMLICTGMLQAIPDTIYEASAIDGSNAIVDFFQLTMPLVLPPLFPILISSFAFNFNNFNLVYLLTAGGPKMVGGGIAGETDLLVTYTFSLAFRDSGTNYGLASAIATLLFLIVGVLAWLNLRIGRRNVKI